MKVGSLFAGIGGFDLGLERAGMEVVWQVEIDDYCNKVLEKHWPNVRRYGDVREVGKHNLEPVDLICGGFPCQPFSSASHGIIIAKDLWPVMLRVIQECLPRYVLAENVQREPIEIAKQNLKELGYGVWTRCISANEAGADHKRNRWWLVAYPNHESKLCSTLNAKTSELSQLCEGVWGAKNYARAIRIPNGLPNRMDRLKGLGNAVVPQIPEIIGRAIMAIESNLLV